MGNRTKIFKRDINTDVKTGNFVDTETGEKFDGAKLIIDSHKYDVVPAVPAERRQQQKEHIQRKQRKDIFDKIADGFTFSYISKVSELHEDKRFTDDEKTRIMFLGTYVGYSEKGSFLMHNTNGRFIYKHRLKDLLELGNKNKFYSFYKKLIDAGIIVEIKTEAGIKLKWSEEYHFKGKLPKGYGAKDIGAFKTYDKQIQELYKAKKDNGKPIHSAKQLYTVFMVLPFVHYETNILCKYPNAPTEEAEPLSIEELAEGLGFKRSNDLKRKLLKIELKEQPVFSFIQNKKATHITVNPFIIWRQKKMPDASLLSHYFDTAKRIAESKGMKIKMKDLIVLEG